MLGRWMARGDCSSERASRAASFRIAARVDDGVGEAQAFASSDHDDDRARARADDSALVRARSVA